MGSSRGNTHSKGTNGQEAENALLPAGTVRPGEQVRCAADNVAIPEGMPYYVVDSEKLPEIIRGRSLCGVCASSNWQWQNAVETSNATADEAVGRAREDFHNLRVLIVQVFDPGERKLAFGDDDDDFLPEDLLDEAVRRMERDSNEAVQTFLSAGMPARAAECAEARGDDFVSAQELLARVSPKSEVSEEALAALGSNMANSMSSADIEGMDIADIGFRMFAAAAKAYCDAGTEYRGRCQGAARKMFKSLDEVMKWPCRLPSVHAAEDMTMLKVAASALLTTPPESGDMLDLFGEAALRMHSAMRAKWRVNDSNYTEAHVRMGELLELIGKEALAQECYATSAYLRMDASGKLLAGVKKQRRNKVMAMQKALEAKSLAEEALELWRNKAGGMSDSPSVPFRERVEACERLLKDCVAYVDKLAQRYSAIIRTGRD